MWFSGLLHQLFTADFPSGNISLLHHCQSAWWMMVHLPQQVLQTRFIVEPMPCISFQHQPCVFFHRLPFRLVKVWWLYEGPNQTLWSPEGDAQPPHPQVNTLIGCLTLWLCKHTVVRVVLIRVCKWIHLLKKEFQGKCLFVVTEVNILPFAFIFYRFFLVIV